MRGGSIILARLMLVLSTLAPLPAFAACTSPAGNAGDIVYSSTANTMFYCNNSNWIIMGSNVPTGLGTLIIGDFCTAGTGSVINCTTGALSLTSQVTGTLPVANGGTGASSFTPGSVLFAGSGGALSQDNANFFWDDANVRLGIGSPAPLVALDLSQKTDAIALPVGSTGQEPSCTTALQGGIRYNTTTGHPEYCNGSAWIPFSSGGASPSAFAFTDQTGVAVGTTITSNAVTLAGGFSSTAAACSGCSNLAINGSWSGQLGTEGVVSGNTVTLRLTSASTHNTPTTATVQVGGTTSSTWTVTTLPCSAVGTVVTYLTTTGAGTWTVPECWNSSSNTIEVIGGGGDVGATSYGGGGGGAYSAISNLTLTVGATINYSVGAAGVGASPGGDTWFNATTLAASSVGAKGGTSVSAGSTGAAGGAAASGIGTIKTSGGTGGNGVSSDSMGGGGGAGGPGGNGGNGGTATGNLGSGGGGGGCGGGAAGASTSTSSGGAGGTGPSGTSSGGGGAGGGGGGTGSGGHTYAGWDSTHGCGGGGGGDRGSGALYGGGGGGEDGGGSNGIIVITYTN